MNIWETLAKEFLAHGTVGIIALLAIWVAWKKDQALQTERDARLADQKEMLTMYYTLAHESEETLETAVGLIVRQNSKPTPPKEG